MEQHPKTNENASADRDRQIGESLDRAWRTGRRIDDLTAKRIAQAVSPGGGALAVFAATGAIPSELAAELTEVGEQLGDERGGWIAALDDYCRERPNKDELSYWNDEGMA